MPDAYGQGVAFGGGTVSSTALALTAAPFSFTAAQIALATAARITVGANPARYRYDGVADPTTTAGMLLPANSTNYIFGQRNISRLKLIRDGAVDASVFVTLEA